MNLIVLTPEQAEQVRGLSSDGKASLEPRETIDGNFVLPERILLDVSHEQHWTLLSSLPQLDVSEVEFPVLEDEEI